MASVVITEARALFDYDRQHFDELSFKAGDVVKVLKQIEGGWWHGELNGAQGWFPSNYFRQLLVSPASTGTSHLLSFQQEIVQHILEGESKQIDDLNLLIRIFRPCVEALSKFTFMSKLSLFLDKVAQIIRLHEGIARALEKMKPLSQPKSVGKLFLDVAKSMDQLTGEYTRSCAYIEFGLQENRASIPIAIGTGSQDLYSTKVKSLFASVHDRLARYPVLLKETENYYEDPHLDRPAICEAMQVFSEILDRCNLLRYLREADIEVLSSEIRGLADHWRPKISDPTLTLKANVCMTNADDHIVIDSSKPQAVLLLYPTFILILSAISPQVYQFRMHVPISNISVTASHENGSVISVKIVDCSSPPEEQHLLLWCTGVCTRDLFYSTVNEFIRNSKTADCSIPRQGSVTSRVKPGMSGLLRRRPGSCRSVGGVSDDGDDCFASGTGAPHLFALRPSHSGPLCSPTTEEETLSAVFASSTSPPPPPPRNNTVAITDLTNLPGCRFLPHEVRTRPHVKWPDDILTIAKRQNADNSNAFNNLQQSSQTQQESGLTHLRLDCALPQSLCSLIYGSCDAPPRSGARVPLAGGHYSRGSRPDSPGRSGAGGDGRGPTGNTVKGIQRRRTGRQKSAINADDILRSTGHLHEIAQHNERDAKILQIVELYCGSGLPKGALKPLDLTKLRLSCAETRIKENSQLPPVITSTAAASLVPQRTYENIDPIPFNSPLRPPPVILPTSASIRKT